MKIVGILLIIFQVMALFSAYANSIASGVSAFPSTLPGALGFYSFAIVGIILIIKSKKKKEDGVDNDDE